MVRILIVDPFSYREIMAALLKAYDFEVAEALDGIEGVEQARTWKPDLILMEFNLPRNENKTGSTPMGKVADELAKTGYWPTSLQACKVLRSDPKTVDVPIIIMMDRNFREYRELRDFDIDRLYEAGADSCMFKPIDIYKLFPEVYRLLDLPDPKHY